MRLTIIDSQLSGWDQLPASDAQGDLVTIGGDMITLAEPSHNLELHQISTGYQLFTVSPGLSSTGLS